MDLISVERHWERLALDSRQRKADLEDIVLAVDVLVLEVLFYLAGDCRLSSVDLLICDDRST